MLVSSVGIQGRHCPGQEPNRLTIVSEAVADQADVVICHDLQANVREGRPNSEGLAGVIHSGVEVTEDVQTAGQQGGNPSESKSIPEGLGKVLRLAQVVEERAKLAEWVERIA